MILRPEPDAVEECGVDGISVLTQEKGSFLLEIVYYYLTKSKIRFGVGWGFLRIMPEELFHIIAYAC